jgi:hypothetical protein
LTGGELYVPSNTEPSFEAVDHGVKEESGATISGEKMTEPGKIRMVSHKPVIPVIVDAPSHPTIRRQANNPTQGSVSTVEMHSLDVDFPSSTEPTAVPPSE